VSLFTTLEKADFNHEQKKQLSAGFCIGLAARENLLLDDYERELLSIAGRALIELLQEKREREKK